MPAPESPKPEEVKKKSPPKGEPPVFVEVFESMVRLLMVNHLVMTRRLDSKFIFVFTFFKRLNLFYSEMIIRYDISITV